MYVVHIMNNMHTVSITCIVYMMYTYTFKKVVMPIKFAVTNRHRL